MRKDLSLGNYVGISFDTESLVLGIDIERNVKSHFDYGCYIEIGLLFLKLCIAIVYPEKYQKFLKNDLK